MSQAIRSEPLISAKYLWFSLILSAGTLGVLIYISYDPDSFRYLQWKRMHGFTIAALVMVLRLWFNAARIRLLSNNRLSWAAAWRVSVTWDFASSVTPSTIGGGPVASIAMTRENLNFGEASAIVLYCIMLEQIFLLIVIPFIMIVAIFVSVVPDTAGLLGEGVMLAIYIALLLYAFILSYSVLIRPSFLKNAVSFIFSLPFLRKYKSSMEAEAENLETYAIKLREKPRKFIVKAFLWSTLYWLTKISIIAIVVLSMLPADPFITFIRSAAMTLAGMFIPTPGGSGGQEGLFYLFMDPLMGRPGFTALAVFMWRLISFYIVIAVGMMVMSWYMRSGLSKKYEQSQ